ncbi:coiled-coil domain-containing protein 160 isoform X2 [Ambystoma mexicanum]|uniref:coiled-coil domain-containing protein 160 isoform X2 n=1 Tax=Ambystoma mexicanum TaxID=8296 RepID=UPI0037E77224
MMDQEEHWVERLLSPHFSVQEYFCQSRQFGSFTLGKNSKEKAKRVHEIYNISKFKEEQGLKNNQSIYMRPVEEHVSNFPKEISACKKETKAGGDTSVSLREAYLLSGIEEHYGDCISKTKDKEAFQPDLSKRYERESDKTQLLILHADIAALKAQLQKREEDFENVQRQLLESKRKASCYAMYLEQIGQTSRKDLTIQCLRDELQDKTLTVCRLNKELYTERIEMENLRLQNKNLQQQLNESKKQNEVKSMTFIEVVKMQYNSQLKKLTSKVEAAREGVSTDNMQDGKDQSTHQLHRKHLS